MPTEDFLQNKNEENNLEMKTPTFLALNIYLKCTVSLKVHVSYYLTVLIHMIKMKCMYRSS